MHNNETITRLREHPHALVRVANKPRTYLTANTWKQQQTASNYAYLTADDDAADTAGIIAKRVERLAFRPHILSKTGQVDEASVCVTMPDGTVMSLNGLTYEGGEFVADLTDW